MRTFLLIILAGCVAALPVAAGLGVPILIALVVVAVPVGWQAWRLIRTIAANELELERRYIRWQYERLARRAQRLMQRESEAPR